MIDKNVDDLNLEDIAQLSGFSRSTVSRVLNNHPNVSERARRQIMEVVNQYNFQLNPAARALASQRSKVIGVLIPHLVSDIFSDPFFPVLLQGITHKAHDLDYSVTLWLSTEENDVVDRVLNNRLLDGLIIASATTDDEFLEHLDRRAKAYVLVGHPNSPTAKVNYVDVENVRGAQLMVEHLVERGYKRIAYIPGRLELSSNQDRQHGYWETLVTHGLADKHLIAPSGNYTEGGGYSSMQYLLGQNLGVDAVFCASDMMAWGAMQAIRDAGLRIPQDIAVGGFDDNMFALKTHPPLTTIRQPIAELGEAATQMIIDLLEGQKDDFSFSKQILPLDLIIRGST